MSDTRVVGFGPFRFRWERTWDDEADARAEKELRIAYGSAVPAGPGAPARGSDEPDAASSHSRTADTADRPPPRTSSDVKDEDVSRRDDNPISTESAEAVGEPGPTESSKDLIMSGGEWISSSDLEDAIMSHPKVKEAVVVPIPDEMWGERPVAYVALEQGEKMTEDEVMEHLRPQVARSWLPRTVTFIGEMPKIRTGKVSKQELRQRLADVAADRTSQPGR